ncbi:hypothetical protein ACJX0J_032893, partial [Zea mays]
DSRKRINFSLLKKEIKKCPHFLRKIYHLTLFSALDKNIQKIIYIQKLHNTNITISRMKSFSSTQQQTLLRIFVYLRLHADSFSSHYIIPCYNLYIQIAGPADSTFTTHYPSLLKKYGQIHDNFLFILILL